MTVTQPDYEALRDQGQSALDEDNYAQALKCFEQALALQPNNPEAHKNIGNVYLKQKRFEPAEVFYQQALVLDLHYWAASHNMGVIRAKQERLDEAETYFRKALDCEENTLTLKSLGIFYFWTEKLEEAEKLLKRAIELYAFEFDVRYHYVDLLMKQKRYAEALEVLLPFKDQVNDKDIIPYYTKLQSVYGENGNEHERILILEELIRIDPEEYSHYKDLGILYYLRKDYKNTILYLEKAYELNPDDINSWFHLPQSYLHVQNFEKAKIFLKKLLEETFFDYPHCHELMYAWVLARLGEFPEGILFVDKYIERQPSDPASYGVLAVLYARMREWDKAYLNANKMLKNKTNKAGANLSSFLNELSDILEASKPSEQVAFYRKEAERLKQKKTI